MQILLQLTQLYIGKEKSFLQLSYSDNEFLTPPSWIKHLWEFLSSHDIEVDLTFPPTFRKQRTNDLFLMDFFSSRFSQSDLYRLNKIRLHMQVLLFSDIISYDGKQVLPNIYDGVSNRDSIYEWPKQPLVTKYLPLWKRACKLVHEHIQSNPLGQWSFESNTCEWRVSTCSQYITDGLNFYAQHRSSRQPTYKRIESIPPTNFPTCADIYWKHNKLYLVSRMSKVQHVREEKKQPYSNVFGDYSLPKGVERKIIHLLRKKRLLIGCSSHVTPYHSL